MGKMKRRKSVNKVATIDDDVTSSSSSSSSSSPQVIGGVGERGEVKFQTTYIGSEVEELANELTELGFDGAMGFITKHGYDRVKLAKERALSRPQGKIKNTAGYIRYLVTTTGVIPAANGKAYDELISRQNREYARLHPANKGKAIKGAK
jgi:hypothetical protein